MDPRFPPTPVRPPPPEGPGGTQTPRQTVLSPVLRREQMSNISPSPYRRKRTFLEYQPVPAPPKPADDPPRKPAPLQPPVPRLPDSKRLIREEVGKLQIAIDAGRVVNGCLMYEEQHLEIEDSTHHPQAEDPYLQTTSEFTLSKSHKIPLSLFDRLSSLQRSQPSVKIASGLLNEIRRVWFGLGRKLLLWEFEAGESVVEAAEMADEVVSAAIVPKNPDLFTSKVPYMLLVTTPTSIELFGVVLDPFFRLLPTDVSLPSNEENFYQFAAFPSGRVFMGGAEGGVSELKYTNSSWFSSSKRYKREDCSSHTIAGLLPRFMRVFGRVRVAQLTQDASRNLLYALVEKANRSSEYRIDVYDLGASNDKMQKKVSIEAHSLQKRIKEYSSRLANVPIERLTVVYISALPRSLSLEYHLLALTKNGIRVYISFHLSPPPASAGLLSDDTLLMRPTGDFSLHIKFPPVAIKIPDPVSVSFRSQGVSTTADKPSCYDQAAVLDDGTVVMLDRKDTECKVVSIRRALHRIAMMQEEGGKPVLEPEENVCCIEEYPNIDIHLISDVTLRSKVSKDLGELCGVLPRGEFLGEPEKRWLGMAGVSIQCLTSLSNFVYIPAAKFRLLTSAALIEFCEIRPVDHLCDLLEKDDVHPLDRLRDLTQRFGSLQVASWLLALTSSPVLTTKDSPRDALVNQLISEKVRHKAKAVFQQVVANARFVELPAASGEKQGQMRFENREEAVGSVEERAVALHLSRILRPVWMEKVSYCEEEMSVQVEQFGQRHLGIVAALLKSFLGFVEDYYKERLHLALQDLPSKPSFSKDQIYQTATLAQRSLQAINLLAILSAQYGFRRVVNELPTAEQTLLASLTFQDLVASRMGQDLAKSLIEAYVRQVTYSRPSKALRVKLEDLLKDFTSKTPSFFTDSDAEIYLAEELILRLKSEPDPQLRKDLVSTALQKLLRNAASVCLPRSISELLSIGEVIPSVLLCLQKAKDISEIKPDSIGSSEVTECYETIFTILSEIQRTIDEQNTELLDYLAGMSLEQVINLRQEILTECCRGKEKQLHWAVFNWLAQWNLGKMIMHMDSGFVMEFLEQKYTQEKYPTLSYLADYSMKARDYRRAYVEYGRLASLPQDHDPLPDVISLERRVELMDLSLLCLDNLLSEQKTTSEEFSHLTKSRESLIFNQKLSRIQQRLQKELRSDPDSELDAANLDRRLLSAEEMYEQIAKPRGLFEPQLELLHFIHENSKSPSRDLLETMKSAFFPIITQYSTSLWPQRAREKLEELGRKYPYCFPMPQIVLKCEQINSQMALESPWLVQLLMTLPLPYDFSDLFGVYREVWRGEDDPAGRWLVLIKLECLLKGWVETGERCVGGSASSVWTSGAGIRVSREKLVGSFGDIFLLFESIQAAALDLPLDRQRRIEPSFLDLKERFLKLEAYLKVSAPRSGFISKRSPLPSRAQESAVSAASQKFSLLPPKALSFASQESPQKP